MKQNKINFFQSPHPRHIDFNNLRENRYHYSQDVENQDERLFITPLKSNNQHHQISSFNIDPYFTQLPYYEKKLQFEDRFLENSSSIEDQQSQPISQSGINQKLQYSQQEDLLVPITPCKVPIIEREYQNTTTAKKNSVIQNQGQIQSKFYERGLKKLAHEAFEYVSRQKKTTYKQVAKKLINQINDQNKINVHVMLDQCQKKGEMNIKRRVYDALNVLIALGLLKRNGNKVLGKKNQSDSIFFEKQVQRQQQKKRQFDLEDELRSLKSNYDSKIDNLERKQLIYSNLKNKIGRLQQIRQKNKKIVNKSQLFIQLPFVGILSRQKSQDMKTPNEMDKISLNQQNQQILQICFENDKNIQLIGDTDLITYYQDNQQQKNNKIKRNKYK